MKKIKRKLLTTTTAVALGATTATLFFTQKLASAQFINDARGGAAGLGGGTSSTTAPGLIQAVISFLLFLVGVVSVIMLIIGGIRFIVSAGDAQATANARNTVLYSIVGIIVAVAAYGIVNFVLTGISPTG